MAGCSLTAVGSWKRTVLSGYFPVPCSASARNEELSAGCAATSLSLSPLAIHLVHAGTSHHVSLSGMDEWPDDIVGQKPGNWCVSDKICSQEPPRCNKHFFHATNVPKYDGLTVSLVMAPRHHPLSSKGPLTTREVAFRTRHTCRRRSDSSVV